jgi:hypothetical protein
MLSKWFDGIGFLFQASVVIGGVLVFSFFDPFDLLTSEKLKLKDTPVSVRSMQQIGELITAEYYGEVIASTMEDVEIEETSMAQEFEDSLKLMHEQFLDALDGIKEAAEADKLNINRRRQLRLYYLQNNDRLLSLPWYEPYINYVHKKLTNPNGAFAAADFDKEIGVVALGNLLKEYAGNSTRLENLDFTPLIAAFKANLSDVNQKRFRKRQLVLLGRGWVKAGFRFDRFTEENFRYDAQSGRIIFIGMNPEILSATINPWFIPEKGVEGFEFLIVERRAKCDYEVMKRVKQLCLDKLESQALERDIFELATKNAQEQLKAFFELLMDEPIREVSFYNNIFDYTLAEIKRGDEVVSGQNLTLIARALSKADSLVEQGYVDSVEVTTFVAAVKAMPYQLFDSIRHMGTNPFLKMAYDLGVDGELKMADSLTIGDYNPEKMQERKWIKYWYDLSESEAQQQMMADYENAMYQLRQNIYRIELDTAVLHLLEEPVAGTANLRFNKLLDAITSQD